MNNPSERNNNFRDTFNRGLVYFNFLFKKYRNSEKNTFINPSEHNNNFINKFNRGLYYFHSKFSLVLSFQQRK